jgi:hypothetical protein
MGVGRVKNITPDLSPLRSAELTTKPARGEEMMKAVSAFGINRPRTGTAGILTAIYNGYIIGKCGEY